MNGATTVAAAPHHGQPVAAWGGPVNEAAAAMILVHGRGATSTDILTLAPELDRPGLAFLAPQAAGCSWYPHSFLAPLAVNEPYLSSGLSVLSDLLEQLEGEGIPPSSTLLLGFSQGACLAIEFAARHPRRYGGLVGLTGGLIGPPGIPRSYSGNLAGTPVFLGSGDPDPHVPWGRVEETGQVLREMGAEVTLCRYPGMAHTVNREELEAVRRMTEALLITDE